MTWFFGSDFPGIMLAKSIEPAWVTRKWCGKLRIVKVIGHIKYVVFSFENRFIPSVHKAKDISLGSPWNGPLSSYLETQAGDGCRSDIRVPTSSRVAFMCMWLWRCFKMSYSQTFDVNVLELECIWISSVQFLRKVHTFTTLWTLGHVRVIYRCKVSKQHTVINTAIILLNWNNPFVNHGMCLVVWRW